MPLINGYSANALKKNIVVLRRGKKSSAQASATAHAIGRKAWRKKHSRKPFPPHLILPGTKPVRRKKIVKRNPAKRVKRYLLYTGGDIKPIGKLSLEVIGPYPTKKQIIDVLKNGDIVRKKQRIEHFGMMPHSNRIYIYDVRKSIPKLILRLKQIN